MHKKWIFTVLAAIVMMVLESTSAMAVTYSDNLCTGGTVIYKEQDVSQLASYAFDGVKTGGGTDGWLNAAGGASTFPTWLGYDFGAGNEKTVKKYVLYNNEVILAPKTWTFEGSNDNSNWDVLDTQTDIDGWVLWEAKEYVIPNSTAYRYYRINISASHYHSGDSAKIGEFEMMEEAAASNGVDGYTKLMIHSDTTSGDTTFIDSSPQAHSIAANGNVQHSTTQQKFGSSSIYFDGTGDSLSITANQDFDFGTGDFTVDAWINPSDTGYIALTGYVSGEWALYYATDYGGRVSAYRNGGTDVFNYEVANLNWHNDNNFHHVALIKSGSNLMMAVDGVIAKTITDNNDWSSSSALGIGGHLTNDPNNEFITGYIDEIRISKGIARWTSDFTPPTEPYRDAAASNPTLTLVPDIANPVLGDTLCIDVNVADVTSLYSAAFDLTFDHTTLQYQTSTEGTFLNGDGGATFFEHSLYQNDPANGIVVVGVSRVADIGEVAGSGTISKSCFTVIGGQGGNISVGLTNGSFEGFAQGSTITLTQSDDPQIPVAHGVPQNLAVTDPGTRNRQDLAWDAYENATSYEIWRANSSGGTFEQIGTSTATTYQDSNCIITNAVYFYKVKAVTGTGTTDFSAEASGTVAGLIGDINKDGRVDGRDLAQIARAYTTSQGDATYDCQANLDRTGSIDASDVVLVSNNFGS